MEVHHHPDLHHKEKQWKEYLLEYIMIVLAVTTGFFAESIREYISESEREQQYIEAFVRDLKEDTASINRYIKSNIKKSKSIDSLLAISGTNLSLPENAKKFIEYFIKGTGIPRHLPNTSAINQLKSTGSLRLLSHKKGVADSILKYDAYNELIVKHNEMFTISQNEVWAALYPIINIKVFLDSSYMNYFQRTLTGKQMPPLHITDEKLNILLGNETHHALITTVNRNYLETQLQRAIRLIEFLEKEYSIKE